MTLMGHFWVPLRHNFIRVSRSSSRSTWKRTALSSNACVSSSLPSQGFHSSQQRDKKSKAELTSEPTRFSSSPANVQSMPDVPDTNEYQPFIVAASMLAFILYFFLLREENDLDEQLNVGLFERIPALEEPHLAQAIPRMRARGEDTTEAEARLKELIAMRTRK